MVRKLIKYDFSSYLKLLLPVQLILLGIAALNRIVQLFENNSDAYGIFFTSSIVLYIISIWVLLVLTLVVSIVRFYQGMYSSEGYLSHTLPVTPTQHILSKLLTSVLFYLGSFLAIFLSFMIVTLGEMNVELFKAAGYLIGRLSKDIHGHIALYALEWIAILIGEVICTTLCMYFCISVGQLAKKRKVLAAFGVYFGLYFVSQLIGTIIIVFLNYINYETTLQIIAWVGEHTVAFVHLLFGGTILLLVILSLAYYFITRYIMSKKLNLA